MKMKAGDLVRIMKPTNYVPVSEDVGELALVLEVIQEYKPSRHNPHSRRGPITEALVLTRSGNILKLYEGHLELVKTGDIDDNLSEA